MAVKTIKAKELSDKHRFVLDEYMQNGFNKSKSVLAIYDEIKNPSTAGHTFNAIAKSKAGKIYLENRRNSLAHKALINTEQVLTEFVNWGFADATEYAGLTIEELKALPPATRRAIQSFKETERTETDRQGNKITTKVIDIKLISKIDAMKETAKIIGAYEIDNKQKAVKLDVTTKTPEELNFLLKMFTPQKKEAKTIDITPIEPE
jgi:hypothetical protein